MGMCLFREEQHDEKIVKLAELKKKFHSVISKEENLQNEAEFLWANCCTKVDNGALGGDTNYNMFSVEKHAILSVTQKFIDQIDGGDEKSLSAIDQIINVLPDRTTFAVFKAYVADIVVVLDDELTRRYLHALHARDSLCSKPYEDDIIVRGKHFCYSAREMNRKPFDNRMASHVIPTDHGRMQRSSAGRPEQHPYGNGVSGNGANGNPYAIHNDVVAGAGGNRAGFPVPQSHSTNWTPMPSSFNIRDPGAMAFPPDGGTAGALYGGERGDSVTEFTNSMVQQPGPTGTSLSLNLAAAQADLSYKPQNQMDARSPLVYEQNKTPPPSRSPIAPNGTFENVEMVRDQLLANGLLMQVFNSSFVLEWKIIRLVAGEGSSAPNQIELVSPDNRITMHFLLSELDEITRGSKCLDLSDDIREAAYAQITDPENRTAAFVFGSDGFLILAFPDKEVGDLCCKAFKTFGMNVT